MRLRGSLRYKVFGSDKNLILKSNASRVFKSLVGNKDRSTLSFHVKKPTFPKFVLEVVTIQEFLCEGNFIYKKNLINIIFNINSRD